MRSGVPRRMKIVHHEGALSRLYAGINFMPAIELGLMQGKCIGEKVNTLAWKK